MTQMSDEEIVNKVISPINVKILKAMNQFESHALTAINGYRLGEQSASEEVEKLRKSFAKELFEMENILGKAVGQVVTEKIQSEVGGEVGNGFFCGLAPVEIADTVARYVEKLGKKLELALGDASAMQNAWNSACHDIVDLQKEAKKLKAENTLLANSNIQLKKDVIHFIEENKQLKAEKVALKESVELYTTQTMKLELERQRLHSIIERAESLTYLYYGEREKGEDIRQLFAEAKGGENP